ncbi:MAG: L,D-transpeptidase [Brevundimonas sp.]
MTTTRSSPSPGRASLTGRAAGRRLRWGAGAALALGLFLAGPGQAEAIAASGIAMPSAIAADVSSVADSFSAWAVESGDSQGLPFLVIDKIHARVLAYDRDGELLGSAPALLGLARGDVSPPGVGDLPLSAIRPDQRITPAGRFLASMGESLAGKAVLWIDYDTALALHAVVTTTAAERRLQRLDTETAADNRISYGCINVPTGFYDEIVRPAFEGAVGVVYILPEVRPLNEVFAAWPA